MLIMRLLLILVLGSLVSSSFAQSTHTLFSDSFLGKTDGQASPTLTQAHHDVDLIEVGDQIVLPPDISTLALEVNGKQSIEGDGFINATNGQTSAIINYLGGQIRSTIIHRLGRNPIVLTKTNRGYTYREYSTIPHDERNYAEYDDDLLQAQTLTQESGLSQTNPNTLGNPVNGVQSLESQNNTVFIDYALGLDHYYYDYLLRLAKQQSLIETLWLIKDAGGYKACPSYNGPNLSDYGNNLTIAREAVSQCEVWAKNIMSQAPTGEQIFRSWMLGLSGQLNEVFTNSNTNLEFRYTSAIRIDTTMYHQAAKNRDPDSVRYIVTDIVQANSHLLNQTREVGADLLAVVSGGLIGPNTGNGGLGTFPNYNNDGTMNVNESYRTSFVNYQTLNHVDYDDHLLILRKQGSSPVPIFNFDIDPLVESSLPFYISINDPTDPTNRYLTAGGDSLLWPYLDWSYVQQHCESNFEGEFNIIGNECRIDDTKAFESPNELVDVAVKMVYKGSIETEIWMHEMGHNLGLQHGRTHHEGDSLFVNVTSNVLDTALVDENQLPNNNGFFVSSSSDDKTADLGARGFMACVLREDEFYSELDHFNLYDFVDRDGDYQGVPYDALKKLASPVDQVRRRDNLCFTSVMNYTYGGTDTRRFSDPDYSLNNPMHDVTTPRPDLAPTNWTIVRTPYSESNIDGRNLILAASSYVPMGLSGNQRPGTFAKDDAVGFLKNIGYAVSLYSTWRTNQEVLLNQVPDGLNLPEFEGVSFDRPEPYCGVYNFDGSAPTITLPCMFYEEINQFVHPIELVSFRFPIRNAATYPQAISISVAEKLKGGKIGKTVSGDGQNINHIDSFDDDSVVSYPSGLMTASGWKHLQGSEFSLSNEQSISSSTSLKITPSKDTTIVSSKVFTNYDAGKIELYIPIYIDAESITRASEFTFLVYNDVGEQIGGYYLLGGSLYFFNPNTGEYDYVMDASNSLQKDTFNTLGITYEPVTSTLSYTYGGALLTSYEATSFKPYRMMIKAYDDGFTTNLFIDDFTIYRNQYSPLVDVSPTEFQLAAGATEDVRLTIDPKLFDDANLGYTVTFSSQDESSISTDLNLSKPFVDLQAPVGVSPKNNSENLETSVSFEWTFDNSDELFDSYEFMIVETDSLTADPALTNLAYNQNDVVLMDTVKGTTLSDVSSSLEEGTRYGWVVTPLSPSLARGISSAVSYFSTIAGEPGTRITIDDNGMVRCKSLPAGKTQTISGKVYEVVDNLTLVEKVEAGADLSTVCTSNVTDMEDLFEGAKEVPSAISTWDVSSVENMTRMFWTAQIDQDLSTWDVSSVTDMNSMFSGSTFNQDISGWDVSSVENFSYMFWKTPFNQTLKQWRVGSARLMSRMFWESGFNQDIGDWDVRGVERMYGMFEDSPFNQDISGWCVPNIDSEPGAFASVLKEAYKPQWGECPGFPDPPRTVYPANNASGISRIITFSWDPDTLATQYQFQVLSLSGFKLKGASQDSIAIDTLVSEPTFTNPFPLDANGSFAWRSRGINQADSVSGEAKQGDWSEKSFFSTGVSISTESLDIPTAFNLDQNYPNPFNPTTTIRFALPVATNVTLEVYTILGQKVATLTNSVMSAGVHTVTFDASGLASGLYIYKLHTDLFVDSKQMFLIK